MANCELNSKSFYIKHSQHKTNIPRVMRTFFLLIQLCFSLDFGFHTCKSSRQKWLFKVFSFVKCIIVIGISTASLGRSDLYFYIKLCIEYFIYCLFFLQLNSENSFSQILKDLLAFDKELGVDYLRHNIGINIIIFYIASCIYKIITTLINCLKFKSNFCVFEINLKLFNLIPILLVDLPYMVNFAAYYSV